MRLGQGQLRVSDLSLVPPIGWQIICNGSDGLVNFGGEVSEVLTLLYGFPFQSWPFLH